MEAKEVTILTGFLGAGKTTLLNAVLKYFGEKKFAIIENEIGQESIDAGLILKRDGNIVEMNNGCLCCTLNDDLYDLLNKLWKKRDSWDHLLIEATGIADPAHIAKPFLTVDQVKRGFALKRVICIVDASLIEDQLKVHEEAIRQIAFSDVIALNKTAGLAEEQLLDLKTMLKLINPFAETVIVSGEDFPVPKLFAKERYTQFYNHPKAVNTPKGILNLDSSMQSMAKPLMAVSGQHRRHEHSAIETILLKYRESFDMDELEHRMTVFLLLQSANVYRIKAMIYSQDFQSRLILQTVGKSLAITIGERWMPDEIKESKIVIIGKELQALGFDKLFKSCFQ